MELPQCWQGHFKWVNSLMLLFRTGKIAHLQAG